MLVYILMIIILVATLTLSIETKQNDLRLIFKKKEYRLKSFIKFLFFFLIILLWFLTAFRAPDIGNDTINYMSFYKYIAEYGVQHDWELEITFQYLCLFLSRINPDPQTLLIVCATFCYLVCGIYIYKYSSNILYSLILLFCVYFGFFANVLRQSIASVIILIAYRKIKDGKKLAPLILILIATLFHSSAIVTLLLFLHKYINKTPMFVISAMVVVALISATGILNSLLTVIVPRYKSYVESDRAGSGWLALSYYFVRAGVFYFILYLVYKNNLKSNSLAISNSILLWIMISFGFAVNLFNRVSDYFLLMIAVDLPNAFGVGEIKHKKLLMFTVGLVMLAYFMVAMILRPDWNHLYPYGFCWDYEVII